MHIQFKENFFRWSLIGLLLLLINSTGCRFGNRTEDASTSTTTTAQQDGITGYYETQANSLTFCVQTNVSNDTRCEDVNTNLIPPLISQIITNPVALKVENQESGKAFLFSPYGDGSAIPIFVSTSEYELSFLGSTAATSVWDDPACTGKFYIEETGALNPGGASQSTINKLPLSGRMQLKLQIFNLYEGDCDATFQELASCYENIDLCGGSSPSDNKLLQQDVHGMFNPYIEAGVIESTDIQHVTALGYEVSYE